MKSSLCITSFDQDCYLIPSLLEMLAFQSMAPHEIILYVSGVSKLELPKQLMIGSQTIPVYTIYSSKRTMQSIARNICSKIASGDIIIFFDVDDEPHPQKIEITHFLFNTYNVDFVLHSYISSHIRKRPEFSLVDIHLIETKTNLTLDNHSTNLICDNMPIHHAHIAVKKIVFDTVSFNEEPQFYRKEDGKFCQDLLQNHYKGIYCPKSLVRYIIRNPIINEIF